MATKVENSKCDLRNPCGCLTIHKDKSSVLSMVLLLLLCCQDLYLQLHTFVGLLTLQGKVL